ncbi:YqaA family protein [Desulfogranum mediterraneum]|uniref:YqaA family protein n=1 Tax=Desulfogranum mediterraneum TaxID=160661 RepID=UPI0003F56B27|nr:VTT domain-containing protein [Desulfogranum mediterraneum]
MAGTTEAARKLSLLQRLYNRCMEWIQTPAGIWALFLIAVAESSFFPIPPDVFLIALCVGAPKKSLKFAAICAAGSIIGGALGYGLGYGFMDTLGQPILELYGLQEKYTTVQALYQQYDALAVGAAGFTPLPYKLFTITAGAFKINFLTFILVSILARSARFFLVAGLIYKFGAPVQHFINRYFNILTVIFLVLLVGGFVLIKLLL